MNINDLEIAFDNKKIQELHIKASLNMFWQTCAFDYICWKRNEFFTKDLFLPQVILKIPIKGIYKDYEVELWIEEIHRGTYKLKNFDLAETLTTIQKDFNIGS